MIRKMFILVMMMTLVCSALACTNKTTELAAYELYKGPYDSGITGTHANECTQWSEDTCNPFIATSTVESATVQFDGKSYSGNYWYSVVEKYNTYQTNYYAWDGGWFGVKSTDGALSTIVFYDVQKGSKTLEECEEEAIRIAKQFIDVDEYELTTRTDEFTHAYFFKKYVEGYETCAGLSVGISTGGDLSTFAVTMTDELDEALNKNRNSKVKNTIKMFEAEDTQELVEDKLHSIYQNIGDYDYEILEKNIIVLDNGNLGMVYNIEIEKITPIDEESYSVATEPVTIVIAEAWD